MTILGKEIEHELTAALASLTKLAPGACLDIEMSWPPDDYVITFLAWANGQEVFWDHEIMAEPWADRLFVDDDYDETVLQALERELYALFRRCWENLGPRRLKTRASLRKHDDIEAMDLQSGKIVQDKDRDWEDTHDL